MNHVHNGRGAPSGALLTDIYETAGFYEPKTGWSDAGIFEIKYVDNIQLQIDRITAGEISLVLWKLGDEEPFEKFIVDVPERYFVVRNIETREPLVSSREQLIDEVNGDRTRDWQDYTPLNWREGWNEFVEGKDYELISLEPCSKAEADRDLIRQQNQPEMDHPKIAEPIRDSEPSHLFTFLEIYELKSFANGFAKAIDHYLEAHKFVGDDWIGYTLPSGEVADVQFSLNEDHTNPNYNNIEAFAYRNRLDENDGRCTDTSDCVRLV